MILENARTVAAHDGSQRVARPPEYFFVSRSASMTSVLIIDDHPIVLQGLRRVLEDAGVNPVLEARDVTSGYRLFRRNRPDVIVVDLGMHNDPMIAARALEAGATGYLLKDTSSDELMKAFEQVRSGKPYLSEDLAMRVALLRTGVENPLVDLTPRQSQILSLLAKGKTYSSIAEELGVSYKTVVNTCLHLKRTLGAKNLPELIRVAVRLLPADS